MMVLNRMIGEAIDVGGVILTIASIHPGSGGGQPHVKLRIEGPREIPVHRVKNRPRRCHPHPADDKNDSGQPHDPVALGGGSAG